MLDEVVREVLDVFLALAQRRKLHGNHVQAVEEVLAEALFADLVAQVAVGGRDDSYVDMPRLVRADGADFLVLDDAEEFYLGMQRHVADFVEEYGAAVRILEKPDAFVLCARKGPARMPEEFAFEKRVGDGAAVHDHELVVHAGDGACDEVLADARFALDEHGARIQDGAFHRLAELLHGAALAHEMAHALLEDETRLLDFLEAADLAHQVEAYGLDRQDDVVGTCGNVAVAVRILRIGENHRVGGEGAHAGECVRIGRFEGIEVPDDDGGFGLGGFRLVVHHDRIVYRGKHVLYERGRVRLLGEQIDRGHRLLLFRATCRVPWSVRYRRPRP